MRRSRQYFLAGAAGLIAVAGAQADERVQPVQFVKVCSLYGDGFYFIPGTDTCIRLGGLSQIDAGWDVATGPHTPQYFGSGGGTQDRGVNRFRFRAVEKSALSRSE